nr:putative SWI/SNF-related matrix-associated actin-dependent regulator of chromatin subfamily A member 3-like 3 [Ipomoea batatas]
MQGYDDAVDSNAAFRRSPTLPPSSTTDLEGKSRLLDFQFEDPAECEAEVFGRGGVSPPRLLASASTINSLVKSGSARTADWHRACFKASKALSAPCDHWNASFLSISNWRRELRESKQPKDMAITQHSKNRRIKGDTLIVCIMALLGQWMPILVLPPTDIQVIECEQSEAEHGFYDALYKKSLLGSGKKFSS